MRAVYRLMASRCWLIDKRGSAAIEFALVAPILILLALGLAETMRRELALIDLNAAANAAAIKSASTNADPRSMARVIDAAVQDNRQMRSTSLECPADFGCAGLPKGRYIRIVASATPVSLFGAPASRSLKATALVRLP